LATVGVKQLAVGAWLTASEQQRLKLAPLPSVTVRQMGCPAPTLVGVPDTVHGPDSVIPAGSDFPLCTTHVKPAPLPPPAPNTRLDVGEFTSALSKLAAGHVRVGKPVIVMVQGVVTETPAASVTLTLMEALKAAVGVPESMPLELNDIPAGSELGVEKE
jgi:hypothetical protein